MATVKATTPTGRSIKAAKTPSEVYRALVAQITTPGAILSHGQSTTTARIMRAGTTFVRNGGSVQQCKTDKWLSTAKDAVLKLRESILTMTLEQAQQAAYALRDEYTIGVSIWDNTPNRLMLLARREFTADVAAEPNEFVTKEGEQKFETRFINVVCNEVKDSSVSFSAEDFALPDEDNEAGDDSKEPKVVEQPQAKAAIIEGEIGD